jgi:3-oxoadipate enol-lactonase
MILNHLIEGSGPPLLLVSGLNADLNFWTFCMGYLTERFTVIRVDNRGVGQTKVFEPECTTDLMAADLSSLLDYLNIQKAHVVGHSLGGCAAQKLAIQYPERVDRLILCSTQAKIPEIKRHQIHTALDMMKAEVPRDLIVRQALTWLYSNEFFKKPGAVQRAIQNAMNKPLEENRKSYFYQINALLTHDASAFIQNIQAKTLLIGGNEDISIPVAELEWLANRIPHSALRIIGGVAHLAPIEMPELFCKEVIEFLC